MTLAKALGGGVMPIGACVGRREVFEVFKNNPLFHSSTFGGNPLAAAAALAAIEVTLEEDLPGRALELGRHLMEGLKVLKEEHPHLIEDVRGRGLMVGVEFADADIGALVVAEMAERGVLTAFGLNNPKVVRLRAPPDHRQGARGRGPRRLRGGPQGYGKGPRGPSRLKCRKRF